jgi:ATP-binding cassette subfamily B protein/ATP-binding cassette subfamily C protein
MQTPRAQRDLLAGSLVATRTALSWLAFFSLCINLLMLTVPLYMLQVYDRVLSSRSEDTLLVLLMIAIFALAVLGGLDAVRGQMLARVGDWLDRRLSAAVFAEAVAKSVHRPGAGNVQGLRDLGLLRSFLTGPSVLPLMDVPWMPVFLGAIFLLHPYLGWLAVAGAMVLLVLALANELMTRTLLATSGGQSLRAVREADLAVRNADVIQAMGMLNRVAERWRPGYLEASAAQARAGSVSTMLTAASKFVRLSLQVGVLSIGAWLVLRAELSAGAMIAASILMARALSPVEQSIGAWKLTVAARHAYRRLEDSLRGAKQGTSTMPLPAPTGRLAVDDLTYVHAGAAEPVLQQIGFALEPGESLAIVGPSAAGKTTLARLLIGNLSPRAGRVRLDSMDVAQWSRDDLGPHIGYLPQDIELFTGTVAENIARLEQPDPELVVAAAKLAGVHEMVLRLPRGYDTPLGPDGVTLSGGQRQRIGLARALHGRPRLVVLDEPNSNLDGEGELALAQGLRALKATGTTVVIITQRAGILDSVDRMLVLNEGRIRAFGPREEVLRNITAQLPRNTPRPKPQVAAERHAQ